MRILIVEDEENITKYAKLMLERKGHQVQFTADARAVATLFSNFQPEVVIVDFYLNDEFLGIKVIEELWKLNSSVKIIVNSREPRERVASLLKNYSIYAYMEKPVSIEDLMTTIEALSKES